MSRRRSWPRQSGAPEKTMLRLTVVVCKLDETAVFSAASLLIFFVLRCFFVDDAGEDDPTERNSAFYVTDAEALQQQHHPKIIAGFFG